jgi:hypothetical protein
MHHLSLLFIYAHRDVFILEEFRDAPDIRPDNPAFFDIRYPAGYQIGQPDIR